MNQIPESCNVNQASWVLIPHLLKNPWNEMKQKEEEEEVVNLE